MHASTEAVAHLFFFAVRGICITFLQIRSAQRNNVVVIVNHPPYISTVCYYRNRRASLLHVPLSMAKP